MTKSNGIHKAEDNFGVDLVTSEKNKKGIKMNIKKVINGTGVIIHSDFGRVPIAKKILKDLANILDGYVNLEIDYLTGLKKDRIKLVEEELLALTGAESALVVNNNAASVLLILNTFAKGKEVIISRDQLIEVDDFFRIPDVIDSSEAKMVEVGATNNTILSDYENAINENTGLILLVYANSYKNVGFSSSVKVESLLELGRKNNIPVAYNLGTGTMFELEWVDNVEPKVQDCLLRGFELLCFSGDKLFGGPQAGIIIGKKEYINRMKKNPLYRALRCDKLCLGVLEGTLHLMKNGSSDTLPIEELVKTPVKKLKNRARRILKGIDKKVLEDFLFKIIDSFSDISNISLSRLPSAAIYIHSEKYSAQIIEKWMRSNEPPILGFIYKDIYFFDMRTIFDEDVKDIVKRINQFSELSMGSE
ncbi:L-seryl-tRNA(Sec) selenium transferase [candidate division KSB1 bacterium]